MSLKVVYSKVKGVKTVTVNAGKAVHKYTGLAEIPVDAQQQLRFFGHWEEVRTYLPTTAAFDNKEALQQAVQAAANGDVSPAQQLVGKTMAVDLGVGPDQGGITVIQLGGGGGGGGGCPFKDGLTVVQTPDNDAEHTLAAIRQEQQRRERIAQSAAEARAANVEKFKDADSILEAISELDIGSSPDVIKAAPNHGLMWEPADCRRLFDWHREARARGRLVNPVAAGRLLGRTPYAVLCKMIQLKILNEDTAYKSVNIMSRALMAVHRKRRVN